MSIKLLSRVLDCQQTSGATRLVLVVLAEMADEQGKCWPSYHTIARRANIDRATAIKAVSWLKQNGFLVALKRPGRGRKHRSNLYHVHVPGMDLCESQPGAVAPHNRHRPAVQTQTVVPGDQDGGVAQSLIVVSGDHDGGVAQPEPLINPELNQPPPPGEAGRPNIISLYEQNFGLVTPFLAELLIQAEDTYPAEWIVAAMRESVRNNTRRWSYCEAILRRYQRDGFVQDSRQKREPNQKRSGQKFSERMQRWAEEQEAARTAQSQTKLLPDQIE